MTLLVVGLAMLSLGTVGGWFARQSYEQAMRQRRLQALADKVVRWVPEDEDDEGSMLWEHAEITILPRRFDGRA